MPAQADFGAPHAREEQYRPLANIGEVAQYITAEARRRGFSVEPMTQGRPTVLRRRMLLINDKPCSLTHVTGYFQYPGVRKPCSQAILGRRGLEAAQVKMIWQETPFQIAHLWIVPTADLLSFMKDARRWSFYLPVHRTPPYRGIAPKFNWWPYEDAWRYLD